jgi:hypothetical protein
MAIWLARESSANNTRNTAAAATADLGDGHRDTRGVLLAEEEFAQVSKGLNVSMNVSTIFL